MLDDYLQYGMVFKQSSITLKGFSPVYKDLFEGFLNHLRQKQVSENSIRTWRSRLFRFEYFLIQSGIERFNQLQLHHVNAYIESLAWCKKRPNEADTTRYGRVGEMQRFAQYLCQQGYPSYLLAALPKCGEQHAPYIFSVEELHRIFERLDTLIPTNLSPNRHLNDAALVPHALWLRPSDI